MRVPSKSSVGVYYPERVEGGVHDLSGAEQVQDHRDAEVSDQEPEGDVHHLADAAACSGHESRAEECDFAASSQLSSCTPGGIAGPPPGPAGTPLGAHSCSAPCLGLANAPRNRAELAEGHALSLERSAFL